MIQCLDRLLTLALIVIVFALTITAIPSLSGQTLEGTLLLAHMGASGAMVFVLPVYAILGLVRLARHEVPGRLRSIGFWGLVTTGLLTIATVFICMLPFPSTDQMHTLILWHGLAGYAMAVAAIVFVLGLLKKPKT